MPLAHQPGTAARRERRRPARLRWASALALGLLASCVSYDQDVHLSPLYSDLSVSGGGREVEALAGVVRQRRRSPDAPWSSWSLRPLVTKERQSNGDSLMRFLVPLGVRRRSGEETVNQLLPLARYEQSVDSLGQPSWKFYALPGIFWSKDSSGRIVRAIFPLGGRIEGSFTYDKITFALFPLFSVTEREGRTSWNFLWPLFNWSYKEGLPDSWRVWPLYGVSQSEFHTRRFWLWPLFHTQVNVGAGSAGVPERRWSIWPLASHASRGSFRADSILWPFFGYSRDAESGYWAWDGPWPLVRFIRPGDSSDQARRSRVWPFYSFYSGDGLESTWFLWPLVNTRRETYSDGSREAEFVMPFWQRWRRVDTLVQPVSSWNKLWPVYQDYQSREGSRFAFPSLNPLWHMPPIDDMYAWVYELYTRESDALGVRERSWGGLWRRERDAFESRHYLSGLWARRVFAFEGVRYSESSLLLGLLRWRSREGRFQGFLRPAFPGPGFPSERAIEPLPVAP